MWFLGGLVDLRPARPSQAVLLAAGVAATVGGFIALRTRAARPRPASRQVLPSPGRSTVPLLSPAVAKSLPYPPDALPGARDVNTPYGRMRVYEWGPDSGKKVILLHGISTPCLSLAAVGHGLVEKGCRVLLFDLFGRGYSDAPDPADVDYDGRFYATQILLAITSSPVSWNEGFTLLGYSLGGGVAVDFAVALPHLVSDLVLVAPGGLLRRDHVSWKSWLLYTSGLLPERMVEKLIWRRLRGDPGAVPGRSFPAPSAASPGGTSDPAQAAVGAEAGIPTDAQHAGPASASGGLKGNVEGAATEGPLLVPGNSNSTVSAIIAWQVEDHKGFVPAFISSIRYAPIHNQHEIWRTLGRRLSEARSGTASAKSLDAGKILMILGKHDPVVIADEVTIDSQTVLGEDSVHIVQLDAGHEMPVTKADEVVDSMMDHWNV